MANGLLAGRKSQEVAVQTVALVPNWDGYSVPCANMDHHSARRARILLTKETAVVWMRYRGRESAETCTKPVLARWSRFWGKKYRWPFSWLNLDEKAR